MSAHAKEEMVKNGVIFGDRLTVWKGSVTVEPSYVEIVELPCSKNHRAWSHDRSHVTNPGLPQRHLAAARQQKVPQIIGLIEGGGKLSECWRLSNREQTELMAALPFRSGRRWP
jgi:hypothetical protein